MEVQQNIPIFEKEILVEKEPLPEYKYSERGTKSVFTVNNISIDKGEFINVNLTRDKYKGDFYIFIDGYSTVSPFLTAEITPFRNYPYNNNTKYYVDGMFVGFGTLNELKKGKTAKIYLGKDNLTFVKKELVERKIKEKERLFKWRYKIQNLHKRAMKYVLVDRVPLEQKNIKVELISSKKWKKYNKVKGKVVWEFVINPNDVVILEFGYKEKFKKKN